MTKMILIAGIAALAIAAPAQAGHGGGNKHDRGARSEAQGQRSQAKSGGGDRRQARAQRDNGQRREQQTHADRPQRQQRARMERPQREQRARIERPKREQRARMERPQREQRAQIERPRREQRSKNQRVQREQRARFERPQREQRAKAERMQRERRAKIERPRREQHAKAERLQRERQDQRQRDVRVARDNGSNRHDFRQQDRQAERIAQLRQRHDNRFDRTDRRDNRFARIDKRDDRRFDRREARGEQRFRMADYRGDFRDRPRARPQRSVGERLNLRERRDQRDWYNGYAEQRYRTFYGSSPDYFYDYNNDDGYLYQVRRGDYRVAGLYPVLGGAFGVGRPVPVGYDDYNVPYGYRSLYYDTPDHYYRYGDGAIYRVDRDTQLIQTVAALLTGQNFGVGQRLPLGYDVYNVPYAYRDRYADTSDMWYRYDDGTIYGVDPYSRTIRNVYPLSYGYEVGYPAPAYSYGGYGDAYDAVYSGYGVPYDYRDLYYAQPGYNYQYAGGGIYRVDPKTQLVQAVVALVTGTTLGVGQALPAGYDVYNVPSAYRSAYFDRDDAWYRYDDGYIYEVDPRTRIIQGAVPVDYDGFAVGYPMPSYAGYAVPDSYDGLYTAEPNYDYRYANGGIYRVDRDTHVVNGVAALLTGNTFGVGQVLPAGYDVYNVPYAYRSDYQDSADAWYRYNDGNIYRVDPQTRVIEAVIDAIT